MSNTDEEVREVINNLKPIKELEVGMGFVTVEVNFRAVHTNNYQGGGGKVYFESLLMLLDYDFRVGDIMEEAEKRLEGKQPKYYRMENVEISNITIKKSL